MLCVILLCRQQRTNRAKASSEAEAATENLLSGTMLLGWLRRLSPFNPGKSWDEVQWRLYQKPQRGMGKARMPCCGPDDASALIRELNSHALGERPSGFPELLGTAGKGSLTA